MIIVSGYLLVDPAQRDAYLAATFEVARLARVAPGCLDFVQVADPLADDRIVIYERWESDEELMAFRNSGTGGDTNETHETDETPDDTADTNEAPGTPETDDDTPDTPATPETDDDTPDTSDTDEPTPELLGAAVAKYRISAVESP